LIGVCVCCLLSLCCLSPSRLVLFCISLFEGTVVKEEAWLTVRNRIALFINLKSQGILGMAGLPEQAIADFEDIRQRVIAHAFRKCVRFAISLRVHRAAADETIVDVIARMDVHKQWRCTQSCVHAYWRANFWNHTWAHYNISPCIAVVAVVGCYCSAPVSWSSWPSWPSLRRFVVVVSPNLPCSRGGGNMDCISTKWDMWYLVEHRA
jgi:hypothetical protein